MRSIDVSDKVPTFVEGECANRNTLGPICSPPAGRLVLMPSPGGCFMSCARHQLDQSGWGYSRLREGRRTLQRHAVRFDGWTLRRSGAAFAPGLAGEYDAMHREGAPFA